MNISIRKATAADSEKLFSLITDLAVHQGHLHDVKTNAQDLRRWLCESNPPFECLFAERNGEVLGFALFCSNFSTWEGHPGIYLEDLYVGPQERGTGIGKLLLEELSRLALSQDCKRLEFRSLISNQSAYNFNQSLGATPIPEFILWRLEEDDLERLASTQKLNLISQNQLSSSSVG